MTDISETCTDTYSDTCTERDDYKQFDSDEDEEYIKKMEQSEEENHKDFISDSESEYSSSVYSSSEE